jgi:ABC-type glycerol-3-phosphate transport system permease component
VGIIKKIFFDLVRGILIIMVLFWSLFPLYWMCSVALRNSQELAYSLNILNKSISFENFLNLFNNENFQTSINNSGIITVLSLILSLLLGITIRHYILLYFAKEKI